VTNKRQNAEAGFTLLEVLVAFVILGLTAAALLSVFGNGLVKVSSAENERTATLAAQSTLARIGADIPLETGARQGEMPGGVRWKVSIEPYQTPPSDPSGDQGPPLITTPYIVTVHAAAGPRAQATDVSLVSLRLKTESSR
jgi:general secretion pathway protein I